MDRQQKKKQKDKFLWHCGFVAGVLPAFSPKHGCYTHSLQSLGRACTPLLPVQPSNAPRLFLVNHCIRQMYTQGIPRSNELRRV
jgi:hypothetical protein